VEATAVGYRAKGELVRAVLVLALVLAALAPGVASARELPVPRVTIYPGDVIDAGMLIERNFGAAALKSPVVEQRQSLIGKVARKTLLPGYPIATNAIKDPDVIMQGALALVIYQSGALTITSRGMALESGGTGDVISIRNVDSGTTIKGTVEADGTVRVGPP
jgi:flagella basal body P-ring formation protein FlgA